MLKKSKAGACVSELVKRSGLEQIFLTQTTTRPQNRVVVTKRDIKALQRHLGIKKWLEDEVFPKIKPVEFDCCLAS